MGKVRLFSANVGLAALVVLDVPLVVAAVHHGSAPAVSANLQTLVSESATTAPTSSGALVPQVRPAGHPVMLSVSSASDGWRARAGCGRAPHLAATSDGGRTWTHIKAPAAHVLRINQTGVLSGWIVGADASCTPAFYSTANGGATWAAAAGIGQSWVVVGRQLHLPSGALVDPCGSDVKPEAVTASDVSTAIVQCGAGLRVTTDGGVSWHPAGRLPRHGKPVAAALEPAGDGRGVALLSGASGCPGLAVARTSDGGTTWRGRLCLENRQAPAAVALAGDGSGYLTAAGGDARTSSHGKAWVADVD